MKKNRSLLSHNIPDVFIFLLIGIFAVTSLTLMLIGTRVYRRVTDSAATNADSQMILSYLSNKIRAFDEAGGVKIVERDGQPVLCLYDTVDGENYETSIYAYEGAIWERLAPAGDPFVPGDGQKLVNVRSLRFSMLTPGLLEAAVVMESGETRTLRTALRTYAAQEVS